MFSLASVCCEVELVALSVILESIQLSDSIASSIYCSGLFRVSSFENSLFFYCSEWFWILECSHIFTAHHFPYSAFLSLA
jgi:hypothetical protein